MAVDDSFDFLKAYKTAVRQLGETMIELERLEKRRLSLRSTIESLAAHCRAEGIEIEPSPEASYLLETSTLADEIRSLLKSRAPHWLRPNQIKMDLERLGCDLTKYQNPQATIQMVLKRLAETGTVQEQDDDEGKKSFRALSLAEQISQQFMLGTAKATVTKGKK